MEVAAAIQDEPRSKFDFHTGLDGVEDAALALRALERVVLPQVDLLLAGLPVRRRDEDALALAPRELDVGLGCRQGHSLVRSISLAQALFFARRRESCLAFDTATGLWIAQDLG